MTYKIIQNLVEELSLELVLSSPSEPESISALIPIIDKILEESNNLGQDPVSDDLQKLKQMTHEIMDSEETISEERFKLLNHTLTEIKTNLHNLIRSDNLPENHPVDDKETQETSDMTANHTMEPEELALISLSASIRDFSTNKSGNTDSLLESLDQLIHLTDKDETDILYSVAHSCRQYSETIHSHDKAHTEALKEVMLLLNSIVNHQKRDEPFAFDYTDVTEMLESGFSEEIGQESGNIEEEQAEVDDHDTPRKITDDDMEILLDFVSEAEENLDTIEVNLIELEQDPSNKDIINDIFRPFHTIKGVSGFLSLPKINRLAHTTENLLDCARSGDFLINNTATDAILESVDTLKKLIGRVRKGTETGFSESVHDIDVDQLRDKLKKLQISLTEGIVEPLGEILVKKGSINRENLDRALESQKTQPEKKLGEILVEENKVESKQVASALMDQNLAKKQVTTQVKVSTEKLDNLVDFAGELVIAQSMLRQKTVNDPSLNQSVAQLGLIVTQMQDIAMSMRMIPIKATFMKMIRLVRDLCRKSGKDVSLNMFGEDTEIDRNVVDALYEPMVHMIRNSVDHGIEVESDRLEREKPVQGNIILRAYHKGGHIVIEIEDDGKGLDKDRILEKAASTGLITGNEQLTDTQIYDLILHPGFSTAKEITDVSGRGVGMDVVKAGIEKFRGHLNIESSKGKGTKFTITLPLTLAIIDGMLVRVDDERYVIPTTAIQKTFKPEKEDCYTVEGKGEMIKDRGTLIPLIRLNEIYDSSQDKKPAHENLVVVVESKNEKRAVLIDELLGKDDYVIKNLGGNLKDIEGVAGGAILSDGRVGLILDIHGIFSIVSMG